MAGQVGRISGGVLQDNLVRNGVDLNFKNDNIRHCPTTIKSKHG